MFPGQFDVRPPVDLVRLVCIFCSALLLCLEQVSRMNQMVADRLVQYRAVDCHNYSALGYMHRLRSNLRQLVQDMMGMNQKHIHDTVKFHHVHDA